MKVLANKKTSIKIASLKSHMSRIIIKERKVMQAHKPNMGVSLNLT